MDQSSTGVPEFSADWYRDIVEFADRSPGAVQWFALHFTEASVLLLGALLLAAAAGRLRHRRDRALALVAPLAVLLAYGSSEWIKTLFDAERPCRTVVDVAIVAASCPPTGDWSFPSNHATIAGGAATATVLLSHRLGLLAAPIALLTAFSRTFVGVHYPHDVIAGVLLGIGIVAVVVLLLIGPVGTLLDRRRPRGGGRAGRPLSTTGGTPDH
jgi:membrane-associated phospholipid phosphatase